MYSLIKLRVTVRCDTNPADSDLYDSKQLQKVQGVWGVSQPNTENRVFLTKTGHRNQITILSDNKGFQAYKGLTIFPCIISITNSLLCRSINTQTFSVLKCDEWVTSIPASQKRLCQLQWPARSYFSTKSLLLSVWTQTRGVCLGKHLGVGTQTGSQVPHIMDSGCLYFGYRDIFGSVALTKIRTLLYCVQTPVVDAEIQMNQKS